MFLRIWRIVTLTLSALAMGASFTHVLEYPAKIHYDDRFYSAVNSTLYGAFGIAGAILFIGAIVSAAVLVVLVRRNSSAFWWALPGAVLLAGALIAWSTMVAPVNRQVGAAWRSAYSQHELDRLPPRAFRAPGPAVVDAWRRLRSRWEFGHLVTFSLLLAGFVCVTIASTGGPTVRRTQLTETP